MSQQRAVIGGGPGKPSLSFIDSFLCASPDDTAMYEKMRGSEIR